MSNFQEYVNKHPKSNPQLINYGTSGLRYKAQFLDSIAFRMGIVATLRSRDTGGKVIGLMITASHNPVEDNGIKLIDYTGDMIDSGWESICSMLANVADEVLEETVQQVIHEHVSDKTGKVRGLVVVGRDTRPSSESLSKAAIDGLRAMNALTTNDFCSENLGLLTTPQLHYIVHAFNHAHQGEPNEKGYYDKFGAAFIDLMNSVESGTSSSKYQPEVHLDCANGVGGPKMEIFAPQISTHLKIILHNKGDGVVNQDCGSSFVETTFREPFGCQVKPGEKWASFDGDADRIIYYYKDPTSNKIKLLNGDKLAALFSLYVRELLEASSLISKLKFGVVQTAYSNGRTTQFIRNLLKIEPDCAATGVKNLMIKTKKYDIAVFFEANGHGSIVYTEKAKSILLAEKENHNKAATMLLKVLNLMNQGTGDAISDLLLTEAILKAKGWNLSDWDAIYETSPSCLLKIVVPDRHFVKSNEIATSVLEPKGLQTEIDTLIKSLTNEGRVVVRPSGTEDIVRVYAEAESQEKADKLANEVLQLVKKYSERCSNK